MAIAEVGLVFQGISAAAAVIQAVKAFFEVRKEFSRDEVLQIAEQAEAKGLTDASRVVARAAEKLEGLDAESVETVKRKIEDARKRWIERITQSSDRAIWAEATDERKADVCAALRMLKQLNGGVLPSDWYKLWVDLGCA